MEKARILQILEETGAWLKGHFLLSSGLHSDQYLQYALALQYPWHAEKFGMAIADKFKDKKIDCVVGPAIGGIIIAHETARALKVRCIFGEREQGKQMVLKRGFQLKPKEKILVVEDVITTGKSVKELIEVIKATGAEVIGVGALAKRSHDKISFNCDTRTLIQLDIKAFKPEDCPLCKESIPIVKPGSRK